MGTSGEQPSLGNMTSLLSCNVNVKLKLAVLREAKRREDASEPRSNITDIVEDALKDYFKRAKIKWDEEE